MTGDAQAGLGRVPHMLHLLERVFPPAPETYLSTTQQTSYEIGKAASTMGRYLGETMFGIDLHVRRPR